MGDSAEGSRSSEVLPIYLGVGEGALVPKALDLWRSPSRPREPYIEAARTQTIDGLIWSIDQLSVWVSGGQGMSIALASPNLQRLGKPRALRCLGRERYGGKTTLELYRPKLPRGSRLEGNTLIFSYDK
jgi:hypothetical protein